MLWGNGLKSVCKSILLGRNGYRFFVATWITLFLNLPFFNAIPSNYVLGIGVFLWLLNSLVLYVLSPGILFRPAIVLVVLASSSACYFMSKYGVVIDRSMIQNVVATDSHEASELLSLSLFSSIVLGSLPLLLLLWVRKPSYRRIERVGVFSANVVVILLSLLAVAGANYQEYSGYFRQNKQLRHVATPINVLAATESYVRNHVLTEPMPFNTIADTVSHRIVSATPELLVIVLGETARADHFPQNGYERNTTPLLSNNELINFPHISSCGTATAHSLPCMFSWLSRESYNERMALGSETVFDVAARAGFALQWYDNDGGCKGLCDRMPTTNYYEQARCVEGCTDNILLEGLHEFIARMTAEQRHGVVVLHQQGSHGPSYYKRSQAHNKLFLPECTSDTFAGCTEQDIINAYDNSIVETGALLRGVIDALKTSELATAMMYISDHGESLGEKGVFLHGLPYWMAPEAQTHVPMMLWLSPIMRASHGIDNDCLNKKATSENSHDMLFSTVLDITGIAITTDVALSPGISECQTGL